MSTRSPTASFCHSRADRGDRADGFVAEDATGGDFGYITAEDVQIGSADGHGIDPHNRVGGFFDPAASGTSSHDRMPGP